MTNLEEYQLLVEKDKLFQENKKLKRAFEMALETMVLHYLHDPEDRKRIAGELMEYYLDKAGEGMKHCPICGKPVLYCDGNRLVCPVCNYSERGKRSNAGRL